MPRPFRYARLAIAPLVLAIMYDAPARAADAAPLTLEAKIPLGDVAGRIDHLAFDPLRQRVYVAELGNNSIGIVDLKARRLLRTISGLDEPQGIGFESSSDTVYVANAGDGSVRFFRGEDSTALGRIDLGDDADNVRIDTAAGRVYVGYGGGALAVIDAASRKRIGDIPLKGHPESFQLEPSGTRIFVNVPDASEIALVARDTGKQFMSWLTGNLRANFPLAIDAQNSRVLVVFRHPARLEAFDMRSGRISGGSDSCTDSDDVFVDAERNRVYVICGEGYVDTFDSSAGKYTRVGRLPTSSGSRTGVFIPELDRLLVAIRASGKESAAVWLLCPPQISGRQAGLAETK